MASDVAVLVFETDEVPCRDIVRSVAGNSAFIQVNERLLTFLTLREK